MAGTLEKAKKQESPDHLLPSANQGGECTSESSRGNDEKRVADISLAGLLSAPDLVASRVVSTPSGMKLTKATKLVSDGSQGRAGACSPADRRRQMLLIKVQPQLEGLRHGFQEMGRVTDMMEAHCPCFQNMVRDRCMLGRFPRSGLEFPMRRSIFGGGIVDEACGERGAGTRPDGLKRQDDGRRTERGMRGDRETVMLVMDRVEPKLFMSVTARKRMMLRLVGLE